jgi:hypothetical protein
MRRRAFLAVLIALPLVFAAAPSTTPELRNPRTQEPRNLGTMNALADRYVKLVLAVGQQDDGYVDAYYGPEQWKADAAKAGKRPLAELAAAADAIAAALGPSSDRIGTTDAASSDAEMVGLRHEYLRAQVSAVQARIRMLSGTKLPFDQESKALYDAVAPTYPASHFDAVLKELDALVPGPGALADRVEAFRQQYVIPPAKLEPVFRRAIAECRARTAAAMELPAGEEFHLEFVTNKPWSGYNWYQGNFHSLIQVNTELPIFIDRAIDLACHEGYPGHHVYNLMLEQHMVKDRGWREFAVYPLFSPQSLIAEGSANFGIEVAFPGEARVAFERDVLFPMAGLDPSTAERYYKVLARLDGLSYAGNEAARDYLDGRRTATQAIDWLVSYTLTSRARAEQRVRFFDTYRSYVINYNYGKDLVRHFVEGRGGTVEHPDVRWRVFRALISSPRLPSGLGSTSNR